MERVSILLSLYHPQASYLKEQLRSLNDQTYENLELIVWNDCPGEKIDRRLFDKQITRFPVRFFDEHRNLGYIGAFEKLTSLAEGDYISYCDQDDIWETEKIREEMDIIRKTGAVAAVCDKSIMNAEGVITQESWRAGSRMACDRWKTGDDITARAAFFCYGTGMTIVAERRTAQSFLPFVPGVAHDQQLMLFLSAAGKVAYAEKPLVRYRRHGKNESGLLQGVKTKADYYMTRCRPALELTEKFGELFPEYPRLKEMKACAEARVKGNIPGIWKYRDMIPDLYLYEIGLAMCPDFLFSGLKNLLFH